MSDSVKEIKRIDWIDVLKGMGIILVVLSHTTNGGEWLRTVIFSFHMPLFFIISGYLYKPKGNIINLGFKLFKSLGIPYLLCACTDVIILLIKGIISGNMPSVKGLILGFTFLYGNPLINTPIWFLVILCMVELLYIYIYNNGTIVVKIAELAICILLDGICSQRYYFGVGLLPVCTAFFIIGDLCKYINRSSIKKHLNIILCICLPIWLILGLFNGYVDIYACVNGKNIFLFYINGILGTVVAAIIAVKLQNIELLKFYGKNSLIILCTHYYFARKIFPYICGILKCEFIFQNIFGQLFITFIIMIIMYYIIKIVDLYKGRRKPLGGEHT